MTNDLDNHMDEYLAEKAEKEAALQVAKEADEEWDRMIYHANDENQRFDRIKRNNVYLERIVAEATKRTELRVVHVKDDGKIFIGGVDVSWNIDIEAEWSKGYGMLNRGSKQTGKFRIRVGQYGDRQSFPQKKDGSHSYDKIALRLIGYAEKQRDNAKRQQTTNTNKEIAEAVAVECGLEDWTSVVRPSASPELPVFVKVDVSGAMTAERAKELVTLLQSFGFAKY